MRIKTIFIIILFLLYKDVQAQQQIKGKVVEKIGENSEIPIVGANVYWAGTTIGVSTNKEGHFSISEPNSYPAIIVVSFVGYQEFTKEVKQLSNHHIVLYSSVELDQVEVESKVNTTKFSTLNSVNMQTLSVGELEKAACCNLSESFSTNATVSVNFTDAISGAKQIKMLGLDGLYTQITQENMPLIRGMSSAYGLSFIPGTWIESIQIIKGTGSVINGFESFTGQINLEYLKPESSPRLYWNSYINNHGKTENNIHLVKKNGNWKSNLFAHYSFFNKEIDHTGTHHDHSDHSDHEGDNFLDMPKNNHVSVFNRWTYLGKKHIAFTVRGLHEDRLGGTIKGFFPAYVVDIHNDLLEFTSKIGLIQPDTPGKSVGLQTMLTKHNYNTIFGQNNYKGSQESLYLNLIRQTYIGSTSHALKYGFSYYADRFTESFSGNIVSSFTDKVRVDLISGLFSEYSYDLRESLKLVAGLRADYYNNSNKISYLPRVNLRYNPTDKTVVRLSLGRAFRIANIFVDNTSLFASNREITLAKLDPELAWNYGANIVHCFYLFEREGTISLDAYSTFFENQIIADIETEGELEFYNLSGRSYANSAQFDLAYELFDQFDVKISYKVNDVLTTFDNSIEKIVPLTPKNRVLFNMSYATNFDKWVFDFTTNYIGRSRIPSHKLIDEDYSTPFYLFNSQISKKFRHLDIYLGCENLLGYKQENPILSSDNPNSANFDASLIYAPINGRKIYAGIRYKIK
mgnify:CR=1 FL=1